MANSRLTLPRICVMCFGHPLLDMVAEIPRELLNEYGVEVGTIKLAGEEQLPLFTSLLTSRETMCVAGGAAMNTARILKWINPDADVTYVGAAGCDEFGKLLMEALNAAGVHHLLELHEDKSTGTCAALIVDKERSLVAHLGAATQLSMQHITSPAVMEAVYKSTFFYTEGFFLNTVSSPTNILFIAEHALRHGQIFCFNLNAPYISSSFGEKLLCIIPFIDILCGAKEDFCAFGALYWGEEIASDIREVMNRSVLLPKKGSRPRLVIATCGCEAVLVATASGIVEYNMPILGKFEVIDTTGAGDAFMGGFIAQYLIDPVMDLCAQAGHKAASNVIRHWGAVVSGEPPRLQVHEVNGNELQCCNSE